LGDVIIASSILIDTTKHIRLVAGDGDRTIRRDSNNRANPLFRITGQGASLALGKPGMEHELFIDGGYLNTPPILAEAALAVVNGPGAKLILHDKVTLQNNYNTAAASGTSEHQNGAGVFIRTTANNEAAPAEFVMKGGTIRGNTNNTQNVVPCGGGVYIAGFGIFTMEGGTIAGNTAYRSGGGFHTGSRGSFKKTGGIIYGNDAPEELQNMVIKGTGDPIVYGYAVCVAIPDPPLFRYRDATVNEAADLSYVGSPTENGVFGNGEIWSIPRRVPLLYVLFGILSVLAAGALVFLLRKKLFKQGDSRAAGIPAGAQAEQIFADDIIRLSPREKEVYDLLLKNLTLQQIAQHLHISYHTVNNHYRSIYKKLGVTSKGELFIKSVK
jgi:DNA-binding CsgD family transcriptional regulator